VYLDHSVVGRSAYDGIAYQLSKTPGRLSRAAPRIGEHTEYVCKEILGISENQINEYLAEGVLEVG
jgi:crotonobetainyl-CoA:carnitine CoA-transferase CaiB-like acyl-CoA transferase